MPTESDLIGALRSLEHDAPSVDSVLEPLQLHSGTGMATARVRWLLVGAAAALVLLMAVALVTFIGYRHNRSPGGEAGHRPSSAPTRAQLLPRWHFTVANGSGYTVIRDGIVRAGPVTWVQETAGVTATSGPVTGRVVMHEGSPGGYQGELDSLLQGPAGHGKSVSVNGRPGYFVPGTRIDTRQLNVRTGQPNPWASAGIAVDDQPMLIWQLPHRTWAMLSGTFGFQPDHYDYDNTSALRLLTRVARATRYTAGQPVSMPFRLLNVPAGLVPESMHSYVQPAAQCLGYGTGRGPYPSGSVGSVITVCRSRIGHDEADSQTEPSAFQSLLHSGAELATRVLPDRTTLTILAAPGHLDTIDKTVAAQLAKTADVSPAFTKPSTWQPVT